MLSSEEVSVRRTAPTSGRSALSDADVVLSDELEISSYDRLLLETVLERQLASFRSLEENWDSYGALPIDENAIRSARALLVELAVAQLPSPYVVPTSKGGLALEWHGQARELGLEILPGNRGAEVFFANDETGEEWALPFWEAGERFVATLIGMNR
jgi:hypothetical protein